MAMAAGREGSRERDKGGAGLLIGEGGTDVQQRVKSTAQAMNIGMRDKGTGFKIRRGGSRWVLGLAD